MISTGRERETLRVQLLDLSFFQEKSGKMDLEKLDFLMFKQIKKQMVNDAMTQTLVSSKSSMQASMNTAAIGQILMNFVVAVGVTQLLGTMNALQIMSF